MDENKRDRFLFYVANATRDNFVARIIVQQYMDDGSGRVDSSRTLERHVNQHRAIGAAIELLSRCEGIPEDIIARLEELKLAAKPD